MPGALLAWPVVDRWERKLLIAVMTGLVGALFVVCGVVGAPSLVLAAGFLISMLLQTQTVFLYAYLPEMFPTHLRGIGAGVANGLGRLGVFAGGFIIAPLVSATGFSGYFLTLAVILVAGGAVTGIFGLRTTNRPLVENAAPAFSAGEHQTLDVHQR